ncbi:MAG: hypothetical protein ABIH46_02415 [Chloroflexota bacterium]
MTTIKLFFADLTSGPDCHNNMFTNPASRGEKAAKPRKPQWWEVLLEQLLNSILVGGIAGLSTLASGQASWKVTLVAFGLTALIELRKYRHLMGRY